MKKITLETLAASQGQEGSPVYIAHEEKVYDVSASKLWNTGNHMGLHRAGADLTTEIGAAPHGTEVLERFKQVGVLTANNPSGQRIPPVLARVLTGYPVLKRHPHPMTVHFPIVFMFTAAVATILYLFTKYEGFELTALCSLGAGILFVPIAMATGYFTWWLNYMAKPMGPVTIKKRLSITLLAIDIILFVWRITTPAILSSPGWARLIYVALAILLLPMVTVIGWFGASLTFPMERE
jgi:predicted heme/steroid binding protein/uncharacterized membrane protein